MNAVIIFAESTRRALPKGARPSPVAHLESILERGLTAAETAEVLTAFGMGTTELRSHIGSPTMAPGAKKARTTKAPALPKPVAPPTPEQALKSRANAAFAAAFASAPDGQKRRLAGKAYRLVMESAQVAA